MKRSLLSLITMFCLLAAIAQETCDDGIDNDADQLYDCADPDCAASSDCGNAIACSPDGIVFYQTIGAANLYIYDPEMLSYTLVASNSTDINAIGYNTRDGFIYGIGRSDDRLYRVGADGIFQDMGAISGLPSPSQAYISGDFDLDGNFYVSDLNPNTLVRIDIAERAASVISLSTTVSVSDFSYHPQDDVLYTIDNNTSHLLAIDRATGQVTDLGSLVPSVSCPGSYGAVFVDNDGIVYFFCNEDGSFYRLDTDTRQVELLQETGLELTSNDGAACPLSPPPPVFDTLDCPGELVFLEDFGSGAVNPGPELPPGTTTYCYEDLAGSCPSNPGITPGSLDDGSYSIMNDPESGLIFANGDTTGWLSMQDHTSGDVSGYMLVVNASFDTGEFYRLNDIPVVMGNTYSFSAWFANILTPVSLQNCGGNEIPANVNFIVEDAATGSVLGALSTGDIFGTGTPLWVQTDFIFTAASSTINIVLVNNSPGGCGNDFAIDDIRLTGCAANSTAAVDDEIEGCQVGGLVLNVLENDSDPEGDALTVTGIIADLDGNGVPETTLPADSPVSVGGIADDGGATPEMGQLEVGSDGQAVYLHAPDDIAGLVVFDYIMCDDGIPQRCDTARVTVRVTCETDTLECPSSFILFEDFGAGLTNPGPELPPGTNTYCFEDLMGSCPNGPGGTQGSIDDGSYSIMNDPRSGIIYSNGDTTAWISTEDHTPDDTGGYMLVVNADFEPGEFFRLNGISVFPGDNYAFSAWFINILSVVSQSICQEDEVPVNVRFEVEDAADGTVLGSITTGDIFSAADPQWVRQEFLFTATSSTINIVLSNNGPGGCGNDFAIDDISLAGCIANTTQAVDDQFTLAACDTLEAQLTGNDLDEQGDLQTITGFTVDTDGDGVPETDGQFGQLLETGGVTDAGDAVSSAGYLLIKRDGSLEFFNERPFGGYVYLSYTICDDGVPNVCDTAVVAIGTSRCSELCPVPDFLSPNGDGFNDVFFIECAPEFPEMQVLFYNRWGNQVYDSGSGYDNSWDGTYGRKGQPLPEGVYYYIVRFNDEDNTSRAGDVLILR